MKPNRRQFLTIGAAAAASVVAAPTVAGSTLLAPAATHSKGGRYGSGTLGSWANRTRAITKPTLVRRVRATDGVYMFGDSISMQDGKALAIRLLERDGTRLALYNWSSRPSSGAVDALQQWATAYGLPHRILMASGSNDIFDPPKLAAQIDRAVSIVGPDRTLFWVDIQVTRKNVNRAMKRADQRNSAWLNSQLFEAEQKYPNLRIIRWSEWLHAKSYRLTSYLRDGVHPSVPLGQNARNELIVQALVQR
jgi:hypothetical protein